MSKDKSIKGKNAKKSLLKVSTTEGWIESMKEKYPASADNFINMLKAWGYETVGHAFGKISESFNKCIDFYLHKYDLALNEASAKNLELLKEHLERAFEKSESFGREFSYDAYNLAAA